MGAGGRPCSPAALDCMNRRRLAYDDRSAVLVHGDIHEMNALQASDGSYKLIDPVGLRAEPACDVGTIVRCNPDLGDDLWARTEQLASRTGVDATAIWEWGTIHRVVSGVYARSIGFQPLWRPAAGRSGSPHGVVTGSCSSPSLRRPLRT